MIFKRDSRKKGLWLGAVTLVIPVVLTFAPVPAHAYSNTVAWSGNGASAGEGFSFNSEICGIENGAPVDGAYIYWVLTASKATAADVDFDGTDGDSPVSMEKKGKGSFHKLQIFSGSFVAPTSVVSTHNGPTDKKANLVVSHGCPGEDEDCGTDPLSGYDSNDGTYEETIIDDVTDSLVPILADGGNPVTVSSIFAGLNTEDLFTSGCMNLSIYDDQTLFYDFATQFGVLPYTMSNRTVVNIDPPFPNLLLVNEDSFELDVDISNLILVFTWTNGSVSTTHTFT